MAHSIHFNVDLTLSTKVGFIGGSLIAIKTNKFPSRVIYLMLVFNLHNLSLSLSPFPSLPPSLPLSLTLAQKLDNMDESLFPYTLFTSLW